MENNSPTHEVEVFNANGEVTEVIVYDGSLSIVSVGHYSETKGDFIRYKGEALVWLRDSEPILWENYLSSVVADFETKKRIANEIFGSKAVVA